MAVKDIGKSVLPLCNIEGDLPVLTGAGPVHREHPPFREASGKLYLAHIRLVNDKPVRDRSAHFRRLREKQKENNGLLNQKHLWYILTQYWGP